MFRRYQWDLEAKGTVVVSQAEQEYYKLDLKFLDTDETLSN